MLVPHERAEQARALAVDLYPEGFEEVERYDGLELAGYTQSGPDARLAELGAVRVADVAPGWEDEWRRFHRPVRIGCLWVGPPWERPDPDAVAVVVDPGRAFGTGAHPTTRLSLELVGSCEPGSLVDLGCGSGVVAIAAAKLGFAPVVALDVDAAAVAATVANAEANGVEIEARQADVAVDELPAADVAVANIALATVERVAERVQARVLIASGYLESESPSLVGWEHVERRTDGGWAADRFTAA